MCFYVCISCLKPDIHETEMFKEPFILWNTSDTPVGKIVSRNIANTASFVVTYAGDSYSLINRAGKELRHATPFIEYLRFATEHSKSVSLMLFWSVRGVDTKKVKCESQCKITVDSFLNIFPDIKENVLYIIHKDYSKLYQ